MMLNSFLRCSFPLDMLYSVCVVSLLIFWHIFKRTHREIIFNATSNSSWILRHSFQLFCFCYPSGSEILILLLSHFSLWTEQKISFSYQLNAIISSQNSILLMTETNFHFTLLLLMPF